jgi:hypothetical protein
VTRFGQTKLVRWFDLVWSDQQVHGQNIDLTIITENARIANKTLGSLEK